VKVQVVASQIGEHRGMKLDSVYPAKRQRVRRDLGNQMGPTARFKLRGKTNDIQRFRGRIRRWSNFTRQPVFDGSDQSRDLTRSPQKRFDQVRRCGLAVGSSDSCKVDTLVRVLIKRVRGGG